MKNQEISRKSGMDVFKRNSLASLEVLKSLPCVHLTFHHQLEQSHGLSPGKLGFPVLLSHGHPPTTSSLPELALLPEANPSRVFVLPLPSPLGCPYSPWHPTSILASPNKYARSPPRLKKPSFSPSPFLPWYCPRSANLLEKVTCFSHHLCLRATHSGTPPPATELPPSPPRAVLAHPSFRPGWSQGT